MIVNVSTSFTVNTFTGFLATTGMVLHESPEGIITYLILIRSGFSEQTSLILDFLAISAGALVYVGSTHLLPKAEQEHKKFSLVVLGAGVLVAFIIVLSKHN
jgi:zinc transporter ZupT